jgi:PKD repeat protein
MAIAYKSIITIVLVSLLVSLMPIRLAQGQSETSYIIVHGHNPEGVEIASIEGMNPYSVEIYDGDSLIGYGAYNTETHNKPITISPGAHTINSEFNGITKEMNISINPNETKLLTFVFERTEFDLVNWIDTELSANSTSYISGIHRIRDDDDYLKRVKYNYFPNKVEPAFYTCVSVMHWPGYDFSYYDEPFNDMTYDVLATVAFDGRSLKARVDSSVFIDANAPAGFNVRGTINTFPRSSGSFPRNVTGFTNWIIQSIGNNYPDIGLSTEEGQPMYHRLLMHTGFADFRLQTDMVPANENWQFAIVCLGLTSECGLDDAFGLSCSSENTIEGYLETAKMSSVPYDLTGTGVKKQPPVASFTYSPENPIVAETITFNASSSYDPDGEIISYTWDFGDGGTTEGQVVTHVYSEPGEYNVTLTVTDNDWLTASASMDITVEAQTIVDLIVTIPGVCTNGTEMVNGARELSQDADEIIRHVRESEFPDASDPTIPETVKGWAETARNEGKDLIVNIDMNLEGLFVKYIAPTEFTRWEPATTWAGQVANIVSEEFTKIVPEGRRVVYAHSAGSDAVFKSVRDRAGKGTKKMYDDINILNGRTGANELSLWLGKCGYEWSQVKIFTSQGDIWAAPPTPWGSGSIANKDGAKKKGRQGAWVHLHCNRVWIEGNWVKPDHNTLRNEYDSQAEFEVYTQTKQGEIYNGTFIGAMQTDWSSW